MRNTGIWLVLFIFCGWPLIVYAAIEYFKVTIKSRDWSNIQWSELRWPWSKHND
jgi:hypothetical protein